MTKIKICGLFRKQDIDYVNNAMPDYIGFVFAKSRRQVSKDEAGFLRIGLRDKITPVGVFVNAPVTEIIELFDRGIISMAQLHGDEDESYIIELRSKCSIPVIKAIRVNSSQDILGWQNSAADFLLLDNGAGGTGQKFDWKLIKECKKPFFLAGGIDLSNIYDALDINPYCIDISSGAETDGIKDKDKILELVQNVRL